MKSTDNEETISEVIRMDSKQIERITKMEGILDEARETISRLEKAVSEYEELQDRYFELENYYSSTTWMQDYEDDEQGRIPKDLKRGVLSEDAVYDLITDHRELMTRMQRLILRTMENDIH